MLLGLESEGVQVDTGGRQGLEVHERLHLTEVGTFARAETIMSIELELDFTDHGEAIIVKTLTVGGVGGTRSVTDQTIAGSEGTVVVASGVLHDPSEELGGVVEVQAHVGGTSGGCGRQSLGASVLELGDEVFVGSLCVAPAFISVQEHIICVEGSGGSVGGIDTGSSHGFGGSEGEVELDFVILQSDQRQSQTGVPVEEEQHGQIETLDAGVIGGAAEVIEIDQPAISGLLIGRPEQLVVNAIPIGVHLVNTLTTNLQFDVADKLFGGVVCSHTTSSLFQSNFQEHGRYEITIAGNSCGHAFAEADAAVESLLDRFESELGVPAIDNFPERDTRGTSTVLLISAPFEHGIDSLSSQKRLF